MLFGCGAPPTSRGQVEPDASTDTVPSAATRPIPPPLRPHLVDVQAGSYVMGSPEDEHGRASRGEEQVSVTLTLGFAVTSTEVTQAHYDAVLGRLPEGQDRMSASLPVLASWFEATDYANALSRAEGLERCYTGNRLTSLRCAGYRLPTEAEWEYLARAGEVRATPSGDLTGQEAQDAARVDPHGWSQHNSGPDGSACGPGSPCQLHLVGQKQPNSWGIYDTLGNAPEWVHDWRHARATTPQTDPVGPTQDDAHRVVRGGGVTSPAVHLRLASVSNAHPTSRMGFRVVRSTVSVVRSDLSKVPHGPTPTVKPHAQPAEQTTAHRPALVRLEPGTFSQGGGDDAPSHGVTLTRPFWIMSTEVTQGQYAALVGHNPAFFDQCGDTCPVDSVNWFDAMRFADLLSASEGLPQCHREGQPAAPDCTGYRLPTEAEWEYAARATSTGDTYGYVPNVEIAWFRDNSEKRPHPVGQKKANEWQLFDMVGNVAEWTADAYDTYPKGPVTDPFKKEAPAAGRVTRGGHWSTSEIGRALSTWKRTAREPVERRYDLGFRLVRSAQPKAP
ncbi:MAG: formylglycine-generating enzyme family protein [Bradymonadia bacterium]